MADEQTESPSAFESIEKMIWRDVREGLEAVAADLRYGPERAWAIVHTAQVDEQLTALLRGFFIHDQKTADRMLEDTGAVSTFGARIDLAFLLGLISASERQMLNLIRKIRNAFAHNAEVTSFSQPFIKDRCLELNVTKFPGPKKKQRDLEDSLGEPIYKFIAACSFLLLVLSYRRDRLERRAKAESITEDEIDSALKVVQARRSQRSVPATTEHSGELE